MPEVTLDDCGRLMLPEKIRERHGDTYHIVERHDSITLIPVTEDPLETLRDEFKDIEKTGETLKNEARETALDEAGR